MPGRRDRVIVLTDNEWMAQSKKSAPESTAQERAAIRRRAKELKAQEAAAEALKSVLGKIASLEEPDETNAERIHAIVTKLAPSLTPKLLYGIPAYANADGTAVLFYQERARLKARYGNLAFFGRLSSTMARCGPLPSPSRRSHLRMRRSSRNSCARRSAKPATNLGCARGRVAPARTPSSRA